MNAACVQLLVALSLVCACGDDASPAALTEDAGRDAGTAAGSYPAVREIFARSCAYQRCHSGVPIGGALNLAEGSNYAEALVNVPACEYPELMRVKPGDPDRSWLLIKLTAKVRPKDDPLADYILFDPAPDWDASQRACRDQAPDATPLFGQRMPLTAPNLLPDDELAVIREWIREGAPH